MATEQIIIEYIAQVEGLKAQLRTVQTELKNVEGKAKESADNTTKAFSGAGESIKKVGLEIAGALGLAFGVAKVIDFAKESIKAFAEAEAASKKLEFAVTKIGSEGKAALDKLTEQAEKFSKISIFSATSIKNSQIMLAQLGLNSAQIEKLIPKVIDLASGLNEDLATATTRAIQGINGLAKSNKDIGADFKDTGDKTENLNILMQKLEKFTGSTGVTFESTSGKIESAKNRFEDFKEDVGEYLVNFSSDIVETVDDLGNAFETAAPKIKSTATQLEAINRLGSKVGLAIQEMQLEAIRKAGGNGDAEIKLQQRISDTKVKIVEEEEERKKEAKNKLGKTAGGETDEANAIKKALEDREKAEADFLKQHNDNLKQQGDNERALLIQQKQDRDKANADKLKAEKDLLTEEERLRVEFEDKAKARQDKLDKEQQDAREDAAKVQFEIASTAITAIFDYAKQVEDLKQQDDEKRANSNIEGIRTQVDQGIITQQEGAIAIQKIQDKLAKDREELANKQAKRDKALAAFNIGLATAEAVIKALIVPPPAGEILAASIAALGAVQLAAVLAKPLPFAKGVIDLQGGVRGRDSVHAMLMPGESVMTTAETERHGDLLRSIRSKNLDEYLMDNYINPKLSAILGNSTADNIAKSAKLNGLDEYSLARLMSRNKGVNVQNADYLAQRIASEITRKSGKTIWA